ncbi:divisome protein SepX/GlpR [Pseudonocardia saturnea]
MPSSLIFAVLVVLWLLILVPAVARHQQEVARPSVAALSGRVLDRPQRRYSKQEVDDVHDSDHDDGPRGTTRVTEPARIPEARTAPVEDEHDEYPEDGYADDGHPDDELSDDELPDDEPSDDGPGEGWERPAPRYRPGRGGFDPEAAAVTARARYAFRQRVVLGLLVTAVLSAVLAVVALPALWWLHVVVDLALVGYLVYLRRQVRMEETIRHRRAARMAGTRHPSAADDPELDEWARRGQQVARRPADEPVDDAFDSDEDLDEDQDDDLVEAEAPDPARVTGTGEPIGPLRVTGADQAEQPALPRLTPAPPPPLPAGTTVVGDDLDDPELHDLGGPVRPDYRRAVGQ